MREHYAERRFHGKRLRIVRSTVAYCGVSRMTDSDIPRELFHMTGVEYVAHETEVFSQTKFTVISHHAGRILTAMLYCHKPVIHFLDYRAIADNS
jgi:hypothetical protein